MEMTLAATKRNTTGKKVSNLRKTGKLPGVLYGHDVEATSLEVDEKDFLKVFKKAGESTLINLVVDGQARPVLIHEVQNHFLSDYVQHVDFYAVDMTEKLHAKIPLHFVGESPAVKNLGGVLVKNLQEVEVECLPADLPPFIELDISKLAELNQAFRVSGLMVSDKVKILTNADDMVVNVAPPRSEEELKELEQAPVAEDVTKVEGVIKPEAVVDGVAAEEKAEDKTKDEKKDA
ncbi:MAG: hypothetical protein A3H72_02005 [Candidatus Doudnabacteria bacterium RIFCSPLOWO2_02_FULL_48_8]|uniref:Large ribosomal subunit protein bL25 n=1 Tax=Candidatus Doudnabacteria bacterium RIFCSPHIGHO2_01_FULL_46_24 TaxID=1817825 RepID=A0A1F5NW66_9BACT|nr:MAG: hypothetical protein A2720_01930 [Candidatus Doudnabacteria bacterium RIFCSPHIGHO2_01_FULL_46_24]OGE95366.1 MAG: hypothetical protein A3E98_00790 [Candidatus Doudnabacteria bacterium RIFCSPHIGHO2_12_FULL_48_11]OGE95781.1 MAG: hypothetical protein A3H72_02005 [Candidatus Doudnabacteria bacterium RIFCSPLOWO2_02_FULL_48_8]